MQEAPQSISTADCHQEREQYSKTISCIRTRKSPYVLRSMFFCLRPYSAIRNVLHDARDTDTATKTVEGAIHWHFWFISIHIFWFCRIFICSFIYLHFVKNLAAINVSRPLSPAPTVFLLSAVVLLLSTLMRTLI